MVIVPNSRIRLLKSPIELDERNQLTFSNVTAQTNYFLSLPYLEYDNCTYQRKEGVIRYETEPNGITYEDLLGYNYCMYQNTAYDNKWFYAFITDIRYVNDGMTEIKIETDVIETWKFEINYKPSFVEREHVSNDSIGLHTYPEGLETGEYTEVGIDHYSELDDTCPVMMCSVPINDPTSNSHGSFQSGKYEACHYYIFCGMGSDHYYGTDQMTCINNAIKALAGYTENIQGIFMAPQKLVNWSVNGSWTNITGTTSGYRAAYAGADNPVSFSDFSITRPSSIGSYTPKNKKVLCYPYNYLLLVNNSGGNAVYHYEDFTYEPNDPTLKFEVKGVIVPGCSIKAIPKNYKGQASNTLEGLNAGKYPLCSWPNDLYTNWLTQNAVNIAIDGAYKIGGLAAGAVMSISGVGTPAGEALVAGSVMGIADSVKTIYQHSFSPVQAEGDVNSGDITFSTKKTGFEAHKCQIREEYARIIDNYFSMFGYKVNTLKTPAFETRLNWNYIKTNGLNITGDIPQSDMQKIKDIFNNGITFWHNPTTFLDYSQSNSIV